MSQVEGLDLAKDKEGGSSQANGSPCTTTPAVTTTTPAAVPAPGAPAVANDALSEEGTVTAADLSLMRKVMRKGIIESKNNVEIYQKDPNNPLYSIKTFEALNLRPELLKGIYEMGFKLPSKIQEFSLPTLLAEP